MYLFFDTETTGLPRNWNAPVEDTGNWPRLVQLAWVAYDRSGKETAGRVRVVRPEGFEIPAEAARVHGITTEKARREGEDLDEVLAEFAARVQEAKYLVAHNMNYDEKIMGAEFLRRHIDSRLFEKERICTMLSTVDFCAIPAGSARGYKWPRLSELHVKLFGEDFDGAHDALVDTGACARCFFELKRRQVIRLPEPEEEADPRPRQASLF